LSYTVILEQHKVGGLCLGSHTINKTKKHKDEDDVAELPQQAPP
jgi:hypothetical protein